MSHKQGSKSPAKRQRSNQAQGPSTASEKSSNDKRSWAETQTWLTKILVVYGRKPVLEALQDHSLQIEKLHLADSNKAAGILQNIEKLAVKRGIEVAYHSKQELSRISKNSSQDQGVALDILCPQQNTLANFLSQPSTPQPRGRRLIALDRITNPQNLGMIIRSCCAADIDGLIIPAKGCSALGPLVIKASVGTLFKAPILHCDKLTDGLRQAQQQGYQVCVLSSHTDQELFDFDDQGDCIFVLGNETEGVSQEIFQLADQAIKIPMANGVESLNVAVTAGLISFYLQWRGNH